MQVNSYIFKSPYPSPVQTGQPDPLAKKEQESFQESIKQIAEPKSETLQEAKAYSSKADGVRADIGLASSLESSLERFSEINAKVKAQIAYMA